MNAGTQIVLNIIASELSERGEREGLWFAGHIEALYASYKCYTDEVKKIDLSPYKLSKYIPPTLPPYQQRQVFKEANLAAKDVIKMQSHRLAGLKALLNDFDALHEKDKEKAYDETDKR